MKIKSFATGAALGAFFVTDIAQAGGFSLRERSANAQGASFAGATAAANDVTYALFNPAALGEVRSIELGGAITAVLPDITTTARANGQKDRPGVLGGLASSIGAIRIDEDVVLGLGIHTPFGLTTEYDENFIGAFDGIRSELITLAVTPMIAIDLHEDVTFGAGFSIIYNDPQLTRAVGVDANGNVQEAKLNATELTTAASFGLLWDITDETRVGASFHTGYDIQTRGVLSAFDGAGAPVDLPGVASISLPKTVSFGIRQVVTPEFRLLGEFEWSNWSEFSAINVDVPALAPNNDIGEVTDYKDSIFVAVGAEYDWSDALTLRAGVAYDQTPTQRATRSLRIPDSDRIWASVGFSYQMTETAKMDVGYSVIFFEKDDLTLFNGPAAGTIVDYKGQTHILSIGGTITF